MSDDGELIGSEVRLTEAAFVSALPSAQWTGTEYAVTWFDGRHGNEEIYFARYDTTGGRIGDEVRVTDDPGQSRLATLAWTGSEFGITWQDNRSGSEEVYFVSLTETGTLKGDTAVVSTDTTSSWNPFVHWSGSDYIASWHDDRHDGESEVYASFLGGCWGESAR